VGLQYESVGKFYERRSKENESTKTRIFSLERVFTFVEEHYQGLGSLERRPHGTRREPIHCHGSKNDLPKTLSCLARTISLALDIGVISSGVFRYLVWATTCMLF
jgi:hypothetical protein